MQNRRQIFIERTARYWGLTESQATEILALKPFKSIRLNRNRDLKKTKAELDKLGLKIKPIDWAENCYKIDNSAIPSNATVIKNTDIVIQNASSFCPVINLQPQPGENILDVCSAPGLKTSHISDISNNKANITANELSFKRFHKMVDFFKYYGCSIDSINSDGTKLINNIGYFDKVLLDAPCSGEASLELNRPNAFSSWSVKNIKRLQALQLSLLYTAYRLVKVGGTIIYSTCAINAEENEVVVAKFINKRACRLEKVSSYNLPTTQLNIGSTSRYIEDTITKNCARIMPSQYNEAFFIAKIIKEAEPEDIYQ